jgi:putative molybdopterin biosynthesis protein
VRAGQVVVAAGRRLGPYDLALAASCGHPEVAVRRPPRVAILPTGDELRPAGAGGLGPGEVAESNGVMLAAMVRQAGGDAVVRESCPDDPAALAEAVARDAGACDLLVVLSGSSRGRRDHTAGVLERLGSVVVRGVAQRPGGPTVLALVDGRPVLGAPGYPVAAARSAEAFMLPLLALLLGAAPAPAPPLRVELAAPADVRDDVHALVPARLEWRGDLPPLAWPASGRAGALMALAAADVTLHLPPGAPRHAGATVTATPAGGGSR